MKLLRDARERAADKGWGQYPEPEWRMRRIRDARQKRADERLDAAFKLTIAGFMLWPIVAPVLLGALIVLVTVLGMVFGAAG